MNRFTYVKQYWARCPDTYDWVGIIEYVGDNRPYFTSQVLKSKDRDRLVKKLSAAYSGTLYRTYLLSRDMYNQLRDDVSTNKVGFDVDVEEYQRMSSTNLPALRGNSLKDQVVHIAWNMTTGQVVAIDPTRDVVQRAAEEVARNFPTNQILILAPVSKVYQPVQIKVEAINANELNAEVQI